MLNTMDSRGNMVQEKVETKTKKIVNLVIMIIEILIILAGIVFSVVMITGQKTSTDALGDGLNITAVLSDSMDSDNELFNSYKIPSFKIGDLLLIKNIAGNEDALQALEIGDVITYLGVGPTGEYGLISHRIYKIDNQVINGQNTRLIYTLGDKQYTGHKEVDDVTSQLIQTGHIKGIVTTKISKVGSAIIWLKDSTHFLLAVVIPLALLLIYNLYILIRMVMEYKIKKVKEQNELAVAAIKAESGKVDEEEIKRKAIEEYLASQNAMEEKASKPIVKDEPVAEVEKEAKPKEEIKAKDSLASTKEAHSENSEAIK